MHCQCAKVSECPSYTKLQNALFSRATWKCLLRTMRCHGDMLHQTFHLVQLLAT